MKDGWVRRRAMWYLKRDRVIKMLSKKVGDCVRCGACCSGCIFYKNDDSHCRIYKHRPATCRVFPLTPEDISDIPTCGYSFRD